jgi:hypothetical protein
VIRSVQATGQESVDPPAPRARRGLPGAQVVTLATLAVVLVAVVEVLTTEGVGRWTGVTLIAVSVVASLVTRAGDRSLPAMMPPLAFLAAAMVAGQALVPSQPGSIWVRESLMLLDVLGSNAAWVVVATILSVVICTTRHVVDRARDRAANRRRDRAAGMAPA